MISGNASLLEKIVEDDSGKKLVEEVLKASSRGAALVREMLVRTQSREITLDPVHLNDCVRETLRQLDPILGPDIDVETDLNDAVGKVGIGRSELERCVANLLLNARDAVSDGGRIRIETRLERIQEVAKNKPGLQPGHYALVVIRDTGCGMDHLVQERIFEPFFSTKEREGRGLGLALIYGVAQETGGYIDVESLEGHGSTFRFYLPTS